VIYDLFIKRPRLAMVISIVVTLAGILSLQVLPVSQYPDIAPPTVSVSASYPGADAQVVEESIAQPVEDAINGVDNMIYMKSASNADGSYSLTVSFAVGTDPDLATMNTQTRAAQAEANLPEDVKRTGVTVRKQSGDILQLYGFYTTGDKFDRLFLSNYLTLNVLNELKRVDGVGNAQIFGAADYSMRIWIDNPQLLANLGLTNQDLIRAIRNQNVQAPAGTLGAAPLSDDQSLQLTVRTKGRLKTAEEFGNIVVRAEPDGSFVRLKDVARVELSSKSFGENATLDGRPSAALAINLASGANAVTTAEAVQARVEELAKRFPKGLHYTKMIDGADFVNEMIAKVADTLLEAFALVAIVVFVFLGRFRPTIIPLLAVPVAIIGAFTVLLAFGYSANTISLLALVLAIGIVVDDAIIVVENVERVMEEEPDLTPAQAAHKAMSEIAGSIIAITLVLLAVFIPVAVLPGSSGVLFRQFAVAISAAMVISGINALTLTPALCAMFLRPGEPASFMRPVSAFIHKAAGKYAAFIGRFVHVATVSLGAVVVIAILAFLAIRYTPAGFVPDEDKGYVVAIYQLPAGASLNRTIAIGDKAVDIIRKDPAVDNVVRVAGIDILGGGSAPNAGVMFVKLKDYAQRRSPDLYAPAVLGRLTPQLMAIPGANFIPLNPPAINGMGRAGGFEYILEALQGQSPTDMAAVTRALMVAGNQQPKIGSLFSTFDASTPQVRLDIDRDKAQTLGITISDVFTELQSQLGGYYVNDFNLFGRTWTVYLQAAKEYRSRIDDINAIQVRNDKGKMVPISSFATTHLDIGPRQITRYNNYRAVSLNGTAAPGYGLGEAMNAMEKISPETLPSGYAYEWTGLAKQQQEAAGQTGLVLGLAFVFAYLFLVALYESWVIPAAVLSSVVVAVLGALFGIWIAGLSFDLYAQIGIVVLVALAAKNAILVNTFALEQRSSGADLDHAATHGAEMRFRPVMMTSFAFIMGLVPLATASGPGAGAMVAVGVPVLFGMLFASSFGMLLIPLLFHTFQQWREKFGGWKPGMETVPGAEPDV
jgi:HAE1 family hydrophobic/amphiphilic exporter-1